MITHLDKANKILSYSHSELRMYHIPQSVCSLEELHKCSCITCSTKYYMANSTYWPKWTTANIWPLDSPFNISSCTFFMTSTIKIIIFIWARSLNISLLLGKWYEYVHYNNTDCFKKWTILLHSTSSFLIKNTSLGKEWKLTLK